MTNPQQIKQAFQKHKIDKVKLGGLDIDGILRGKYISIDKFYSAIESGFGFCDVIFGWDSADALYEHVDLTGWHTGYPDTQARIDLSTFCLPPWEPTTAFFLVDFFQADGKPLTVSPRQVLSRVVDRAAKMGYIPKASIEYEYFFFREDAHSARAKHYHNLTPFTPGMFGYSVLRSSVNSEFAHEILDTTRAMDIELEGFHTETGPGVYETAIRYDDALRAADKAALFKLVVKVLAQRRGLMATFMAKWNANLPGCSGHIHQSLSAKQGHKNLFYAVNGGGDVPGMSRLMRQYLAGQMALMRDFTVLFCPTINSYKRIVPGTLAWAPTNVTWGIDNRTTALRAILTGPKSTRVEHRLPGADSHPYLALAASLASGLYGIEHGLELPAATVNAYDSDAPPLPRSLEEATALFRASAAAKEWFGEEFVEHYATTREWEVRQFRKAVTDWELERYFEII
jgi:glutamine synthetase